MTTATIYTFAQFSRNEWTYSEDLSEASVWWLYHTSVLADAATAPDGAADADYLYETLDVDEHCIRYLTCNCTDNQYQAISFYAKTAQRAIIQAKFQTKAGTYPVAKINITTGAVISSTNMPTTTVDCGGGWWRIKCVVYSGSGASAPYFQVNLCDDAGNTTYLGEAAHGANLWGFQHQRDTYEFAYYAPTTTAAVPAYMDISAYVMSLSWSEGRDFHNTDGQAKAGSISLTLRNDDHRFSRYLYYNPYPVMNSYYGHILQRRLIAICGYDGTSYYGLTCGYLETINERKTPGGAETVEITAYGPLAFLEGVEVSVAMQTSITTDDAIRAILTDAEVTWAAAAVLEVGTITMGRWWIESASAISSLRDIVATEYGQLFESMAIYWSVVKEYLYDGLSLNFYNRNYRAAPGAAVKTFTDSSPGATDVCYSYIYPESNLRDVANVVTVTVAPWTVGALADLWTCGEVPSIAGSSTLTLWAAYSPAVDAWTTPVATTDYTANTQADGLGVDKTGSVTVVATKFSGSMKLVFTNADAGVVYLTLCKARGTPIVQADSTRLRADDAASQAKYGGKYKYAINAPWLPDIASGQTYVNAVIAKTADPGPIVTLGYFANANAYSLNAAMVYGPNDYVEVIATGRSNLGIAEDFFIESKRVRVMGPEEMWVEYTLSAAGVVSSPSPSPSPSISPSASESRSISPSASESRSASESISPSASSSSTPSASVSPSSSVSPSASSSSTPSASISPSASGSPSSSESASPSADPLAENLWAYWKMNEESGDRIDSANDHDLAPSASYVSYAAGKIGNAAALTCSQPTLGTLTTNDSPDLSGEVPWTIAIWWYCTGTGTGYQASFNSNIEIWFDADADEVFISCYTTDNNVWTATGLSKDAWHYTMIVFDGTTLYLYNDNVLKDSSEGTSGLDSNIAPIVFWCEENGVTFYFDEVALWTRALDSDDRDAMWNSGSGYEITV